MAEITIEPIGSRSYRVTVRGEGSQTDHVVEVAPGGVERLGGGLMHAEDLVRRSFEFLLEREPKESILREFEISDIGRYFPDYEAEMGKPWTAAKGD